MFDWKKYFEFGVKSSLIWFTFLALGIVSFMAILASAFGTIFGVSFAPIFAGLAVWGIVGLGVAILVGGVLWIPLGYIYEMDMMDFFKKLPVWAQLGTTNALLAYLVSLATGGSATLVFLALIIPLLIIAMVGAVITLYIFEFFDWDVPFEG